jgi:predicted nuclease of predicted toxin-antitoxin system
MRILLDECLPRRLKAHFPDGYVVDTVQERGWNGKRNGELMRLAESEYDIFITMDRNIEHQQNLAGFNIGVILLRSQSNRLADLLALLPDLLIELGQPSLGILRVVPVS